MAGQNVFKSILNKSYTAVSGQPCVFISHRQADKDAAIGFASYLKNLDINVYIDEDDKLLAAATAAKDAEQVVYYIETGIAVSTHLLAVISENTKGSWWVPFEIGSARQKSLHIGTLLLDNVDSLPEYLCIARLIKDQIELLTWVSEEFGQELSKVVKSARLTLNIPRLPGMRSNPPTFVIAR